MTTDNAEVDAAFATAALAELTASLRDAQSLDMAKEWLDQIRAEGGGETKMTVTPGLEKTVTLYHALDGHPIVVPVYMLSMVLPRKFPSESWVPQKFWGAPVFTRTPRIEFKAGEFICPFNPKHPDYDKVAAYGISVSCRKDGIPNQLEQERHATSKHKSAWQVVQREDQKAREAEMRARDVEMREYQMQQMDALTKVMENMTNQDTAKPAAKTKTVEE